MSRTSLKPLTVMHLTAAALMPRKVPPFWMGEKRDRAFRAAAKRERKAIAAYYRLLRSGTVDGYGPRQAAIAHRYGVVTTGTEARVRVKNLTA